MLVKGAPGRCNDNLVNMISKLIIEFSSLGTEIVRRWMQQNLTNEKSILVQAWYSHATSHLLNQCLPKFMIPYDATSPQWVKPLLTNLHIKCGNIEYTPMIIHMVRLYYVLWYRISQRYPVVSKDYTHGKWKKYIRVDMAHWQLDYFFNCLSG